MTDVQFDSVTVHRFVVEILEKNNYRPHGSDGVTWMNRETGMKITHGFASSVFRLRRHSPSSDRFNTIPPVIWDVVHFPTEEQILHFIGVHQPAPELTEAQLARVMEFDEAEPVGESFRSQLVAAMEHQITSGLVSAEDLAGAAIMVIRGDK